MPEVSCSLELVPSAPLCCCPESLACIWAHVIPVSNCQSTKQWLSRQTALPWGSWSVSHQHSLSRMKFKGSKRSPGLTWEHKGTVIKSWHLKCEATERTAESQLAPLSGWRMVGSSRGRFNLPSWKMGEGRAFGVLMCLQSHLSSGFSGCNQKNFSWQVFSPGGYLLQHCLLHLAFQGLQHAFVIRSMSAGVYKVYCWIRGFATVTRWHNHDRNHWNEVNYCN